MVFISITSYMEETAYLMDRPPKFSTSPNLMSSLEETEETDSTEDHRTVSLGRQVDIRCLVLAADGLANVDIFLRRKGSLCQVQLLLPLIAEGQFPGLEQDTWAPIGEDLGWRQQSALHRHTVGAIDSSSRLC